MIHFRWRWWKSEGSLIEGLFVVGTVLISFFYFKKMCTRFFPLSRKLLVLLGFVSGFNINYGRRIEI
jgi:hypothetical protein